jgi:DmsE family decaheme c-type cytochrome
MRNFIKLGLLGAVGLLLTAWSAAAQTPAQQQAAPGPQSCLTSNCHNEPKVVGILQTPHAQTGDRHAPFGNGNATGCGNCHGETGAHASGNKTENPVEVRYPLVGVVYKGVNIASPPEKRNAMCLACHQDGARMNWQGSAHESSNKACNDCHTIHTPKDQILLRRTQADKCFTCHVEQRADSLKYSHHPVREGKVTCSDCHNPHGSPGDTKALKEFTVNETCYNCHADKRGPMLWEHQPVRENCLACHVTHGSNEPRLMKERLNFLCSSCHSAQSNNSGGAFGGSHSIPNRGAGSTFFNSALANQRQCVNCHSQVHGSNSPSGAFFFR